MKPLSVTFKNIDQLNNYYVKDFKNGGFFLPTENQSDSFKPNEKVSLTVNLFGTNKNVLTGRIAYISPPNSSNVEGVGVALDFNKENKEFKEKIEELLKDKMTFNNNIFNNNNNKDL